jgi:hypothetical protein
MSEGPEAFKRFAQFIIYKTVPSASRPGKMDKLPCDYRTGQMCNAHDPANWTDYATAKAAATARCEGWGVGFVFTENDPFWFLDIDGCLIDGQWSAVALSLCQMLAGAYVEVSASGKGLHIFGTGKPPAHKSRNATYGLEFYSSGRFVALTGTSAIGDAGTDMSAVLSQLVATYFAPDAAASGPAEWTEGPCEEWNGPTDDDELIRRARSFMSAASAFGAKASFADVFDADEAALSKAFPDPARDFDHSSADLALATHLAYFTGKDCARIERIMRRSTLARDKWDNRADYLPNTIMRACAGKEKVLSDPKPLAPALTVPSGAPEELTPEDFYAYLPSHSYINRRTREFFSVDAVNSHLRRFTDGYCKGMKPAAWLDVYRAVQQMSWQPSHPEIIEGMRSDKGYLIPEPKGRIYNRHRPSDAAATDADPSLWVNHVRNLYPSDADHIIKWFAYRIQNPGEKINHALVIGGLQGIGKDLMLEPLRYGVGRSNFADVNPGDLFKDFTEWAEVTLLIINEARDLGDVDRYKFYESSKRFIAAPPDTLTCNRKYLAAYDVPNVMAVVITTNNKLSGLYIELDDRRHYVAWSTAERPPATYFDNLWGWLREGGKQAVFGYLRRLDIAHFNPKADPPKTEAWRQIVAANANPEETALSDALEDTQGNQIQIATVNEIAVAAQSRGHLDLAATLRDRKNARKIPHLLERIGLEALPNPYAKSDPRWRLKDGKREMLYVDRRLPNAERLRLAYEKTSKSLTGVIQ